jgi:hypothetical protein
VCRSPEGRSDGAVTTACFLGRYGATSARCCTGLTTYRHARGHEIVSHTCRAYGPASPGGSVVVTGPARSRSACPLASLAACPGWNRIPLRCPAGPLARPETGAIGKGSPGIPGSPTLRPVSRFGGPFPQQASGLTPAPLLIPIAYPSQFICQLAGARFFGVQTARRKRSAERPEERRSMICFARPASLQPSSRSARSS